MSLNVSALSTYTDETSNELVRQMLLEGNTTSIVSVMPGIKSAKTINKIASTLYMTLGSCGFTNSGSTALSQVSLSVADIKVNESICINTLEDYYTQVMLRPGSYNEDFGFEAIFANEKAALISKDVDKMLWQGNTASGSGNLSLMNGLLYQADNTISASTVNLVTTALTASNAITVVDSIVGNIPTDIVGAEDNTLFVSHAEFQTYLLALRNANYFHFAPEFDINSGIVHPGTNVKVRPVTGLQGVTRKILTPASNIYVGVDMLNDAEQFKMFYSQDNDEVRFIAKFKLGVAVAWPEYLVRC